MARPTLIVVGVEDRDHDLSAGLERDVVPGDVVYGVVTKVGPTLEDCQSTMSKL